MHLLVSDYLKKQSTFIYFPSMKYSKISMCALVSQQNLSPATQALCMENGEKYKCSISVMVLLSVPCVTFWVLLGCAILRHNLLFFRYSISEFHKRGLLVHFII